MSDKSFSRLKRMDPLFRVVFAFNIALFLTALGMIVGSCRTAAPAAAQPQVLTVSELDVIDHNGVIRARLGGDLPDAVFNGKPVPRGQKAAGVLLYDDTGQERGGYITFSPGRQVALTLDNRTAPGQTAMLVAGANGGSALTLAYGNDLVELRVDDETGPSIHAMRAKQVAFHVPPVTGFEKTEGCKEYRNALAQYSRDQLLASCRSRLSEEACQACIGMQQ